MEFKIKYFLHLHSYFLVHALLLLIGNEILSCFLTCKCKVMQFNLYAAMLLRHQGLCLQMPIHPCLYMGVITWRSMAKFLNMSSLSPVWTSESIYLLYNFFMLEAKESTLLPANLVSIEYKSPKSTGIIEDLHQMVQGMAALHLHPWQEELATSTAMSTEKRQEQAWAVSWVAGPWDELCATSTTPQVAHDEKRLQALHTASSD